MSLPILKEKPSGQSRKLESIADLLMDYNQKKQQKQQAAELSKSILSQDPENKLNQLLAQIVGSGAAPEQQMQLFKMLSLSDPFKQQQQERLAQDSVLNRFSKRIKEVDDSLKQGFGNFEERKGMEEQKRRLQAERDKLLGFESIQEPGVKPTAVPNINWDTHEAKKQKTKGKMKFDSSNEEHVAKRNEALTKTKGNRKQAEQILLKEFEL